MYFLSKKTKLIVTSLFCYLSVSCSYFPGQYRLDVRQGNYLDKRRVSQVKVGMSKMDVQLLIGSTLLNDPYRPETWNYIYSLSDFDGKIKENKRLILTFQKDKVSKIESENISN